MADGCPSGQGKGLRMTLKRTPIAPGYFMTLALTGELDSGSINALCELTSNVLAEGSRHLVIDLSAATRCDESTLYKLLGIRQAIHCTGGSLVFANPSRAFQLTLSQSALRRLLPLHDFSAQECALREPDHLDVALDGPQ